MAHGVLLLIPVGILFTVTWTYILAVCCDGRLFTEGSWWQSGIKVAEVSTVQGRDLLGLCGCSLWSLPNTVLFID